MDDEPFFTEILNTLIQNNIVGNIGNGLNFVMCEQDQKRKKRTSHGNDVVIESPEK